MKVRSLVIGSLAAVTCAAVSAQSSRPGDAPRPLRSPRRLRPQGPATTPCPDAAGGGHRGGDAGGDGRRTARSSSNGVSAATTRGQSDLRLPHGSCRSTRSIRRTWTRIARSGSWSSARSAPARCRRLGMTADRSRRSTRSSPRSRTAGSHGAAIHAAAGAASTEYANVVRDLLDLEIDPAKYLPSDDSTSASTTSPGALGLSSTLVEAYVSAAQKISRLAIGYPEEPTLVVYRTPEDTSQDYHIEGLPFGTRGGMLVPHVFPSDGEYTLTVTPIFGDNMSPTGFGSVPCEKLEILLDGERLAVLDWQGGGRNQPTNAATAAAGAGPAGPAAAQARNGGEARGGASAVAADAATPDARPLQDDRRQAHDRRHVPRHELRAAARPRSSTSCARRCRPVRRPATRSSRTSARSASRDRSTPCRPRTRRAGARSSSARRRPRPKKPPARAASSPTWPPTPTGVRPPQADVEPADGVLQAGAARRRTSTTGSRWCSRASWRRRSSSTASRKSRQRQGARPARRIASATIDLASRLSFFLWSTAPTTSCCKRRDARTAEGSRRCSSSRSAGC